jgi:eukaryotic-like serine/threonine-protein kinase
METDPRSDADQPHRVIDDRYELVELVGAGGMAEVWRARDAKLGRDVAVKILAGPSLRDPSRRRRIEREARALAAVNHPNILSVYDYGEETGASGEVFPYIVTELVDGPDLHQIVDKNGALPIAEAEEVLRGVLAAMERAHAAGIVHGDLKPANVLVGPHGPKVGDFGVARIMAEETGLTTAAATPTFAAPEVLKGARPTEASDIYSAACLAFQMITGRQPYEGNNAWEVATKHLEDDVPRITDSRNETPTSLNAAVLRGMAKEPKDRFPSAAAFAAAIGVPDATVPVQTRPAASEPTRTEVLGDSPDLPALAVFGPLAGVADRLRAALANGRTSMRRSRPMKLGLAVAAAILVLALALSFRGNNIAEVPDVRGQTAPAGAALLRQAGLGVSGISYSPVEDVEPGRVLRTIPAPGEVVERGSEVHIIASALVAATPEPPKAEKPREHGRGRDKDDD